MLVLENLRQIYYGTDTSNATIPEKKAYRVPLLSYQKTLISILRFAKQGGGV